MKNISLEIHKNKKLFFTIVGIVIYLSTLRSQWENIGGPFKTIGLNYVKVENRIYVYTRYSIHYSEDNCKTWKLLRNSNKFFNINNFVVDNSNLYVSVTNIRSGNYHFSELYKTDKLGKVWVKIPSPETFQFDIFNDTLVILDKTFPNYKLIVRTGDFSNAYVNDSVTYNTNVPIVHLNGYHYFVKNSDIVRTKNYQQFEILYKKDNIHFNISLFKFRNNIYFISDISSAPSEIFKFNGVNFDFHSKINGVLPAFDPWLSTDSNYICIKTQLSDELFISNDSARTFQLLKTKDFKAYFPFLKLIDGYLYGNKENEIYRVHLSNLTLHENITNNIRGFGMNSFYIQNAQIISRENPVYTFDFNLNTWNSFKELKDKQFIFLGKHSFIKLIKTYNIPDTLLLYSNNSWSEISIPESLNNSSLRSLGSFMVYENESTSYITKDTGITWQKYAKTNWGNYLECIGNYIVKSENGSSFISKDLISWSKIKLYFKDNDIGYLDSKMNVYKYSSCEITKFDTLTNKIVKIPTPNCVSSNYSYCCFSQNFIFFGNKLDGVYFSFNDGLSWNKINDNLDNLNITDLKILNDKIILGTPCYVYARNITDLNTTTKQGTVFYDKNKNGILDNQEIGVPQIKVLASNDKSIVSTDSSGKFFIYLRKDNLNTLSIILPSKTMSTNGPLVVDSITKFYNLGIYSENIDASIKVGIISPIRPGFKANLELLPFINSLESKNCKIQLKKDPRLEYVSSNLHPETISDSFLIWNSISISNNEYKNLNVEFELNSTTPINENLNFVSTIIILNDIDSDNTNNSYSIDKKVVGSFDPNDKQVYPEDQIPPRVQLNESELIYTIRFQNNGNYPAEFVKLIDTLDANLEVESFKYLSSSHKCDWIINRNKILQIQYNDINLIDSLSDPTLSQGYFSYSIYPKQNLPLNTTICNTAHIIFDYNSSISTNTTKSITKLVNNNNFISGRKVILYPDPAIDYINLFSEFEGVLQYAICNSIGSIIKEGLLSNNISNYAIEIKNLPTGYYFIKIRLLGKWIILPFVKN